MASAEGKAVQAKAVLMAEGKAAQAKAVTLAVGEVATEVGKVATAVNALT